ncbi:MAG: ABC transporter ATP-binding protein [Armatimonadota bacterium]
MDNRKKLVQYILAYKWQFILGSILGGVVTCGDLLTPFLAGKFLNAVKLDNWNMIKMIALAFVIVQLPKGVANYGQSYLIASATNRIATDIRNRIYAHLHSMTLSFFERNKVGHLMSRMTNDVGLIQNGSGAITDVINAPLTVIGGIARMFMINWVLAGIFILFVPGMGVLISRITRKMRKLTINLQLKLADVIAVLEETIVGIRVVKSFGMEKNEIQRFFEQNLASLKAALKSARRSALVTPITEFFGTIVVVAIMLLGGYLVTSHQIPYGSIVEFGGIAFYVASSAKKIGRLNVTYHQTMAGIDRIFEVLDEEPDIADSPDAVDLGEITGHVAFKNVSFSYQTGEQVLKNISFTMEPGKAVAVVGPSGAGKSTVANLVPRFYEVSGGAVLVDDHDIRCVTLESLRKHIGIVPQETILFSGTIRDNIAYGRPDATDEEVEQAARAANAHMFVSQFEDGYKTVIGERGARLSGGERQRIAIARAILKDPRILILDEATSSLDATSERLVQEALDKLMVGRTTLVIAHRLSTIKQADLIIVLGDGRIVEQGSFDELMQHEGAFARLYHTQFDLKKEEVVASSEGHLEKTQN